MIVEMVNQNKINFFFDFFVCLVIIIFFLESHDDDNNLSIERIQVLNHVRIARVRIDELRLNSLYNGRESPSHSSFGRTNKSKRAT